MAQLRKIEYGKSEVDGTAVPLQNTLEKTQPSNKCGACNKPVRDKERRASIQERVYHLNCFVCLACKKSLFKEKAFQNSTGKFHCESCFQVAAIKCARCSKPILDTLFVSQSEKIKYHRECFLCATCDQPLNESFFEYASKPYCREDYLQLAAPNCAKCKQPIRPSNETSLTPSPQTAIIPQILFRSKPYHPDCFLCDVCNDSLEEVVTTGPFTDSDKLLQTTQPPTRSTGTTLKQTKQYYPIDGMKMCKSCAKTHVKKKKAEEIETTTTGKSAKPQSISKSHGPGKSQTDDTTIGASGKTKIQNNIRSQPSTKTQSEDTTFAASGKTKPQNSAKTQSTGKSQGLGKLPTDGATKTLCTSGKAKPQGATRYTQHTAKPIAEDTATAFGSVGSGKPKPQSTVKEPNSCKSHRSSKSHSTGKSHAPIKSSLPGKAQASSKLEPSAKQPSEDTSIASGTSSKPKPPPSTSRSQPPVSTKPQVEEGTAQVTAVDLPRKPKQPPPNTSRSRPFPKYQPTNKPRVLTKSTGFPKSQASSKSVEPSAKTQNEEAAIPTSSDKSKPQSTNQTPQPSENGQSEETATISVSSGKSKPPSASTGKEQSSGKSQPSSKAQSSGKSASSAKSQGSAKSGASNQSSAKPPSSKKGQ